MNDDEFYQIMWSELHNNGKKVNSGCVCRMIKDIISPCPFHKEKIMGVMKLP